MTLEQLVNLGRIATPAEMVEFAEGQRWGFRHSSDGAALLADKNDPLALAFARMLSREPYRTNVLKFLSERGPSEDRPRPVAVPKPVPVAEEPEPDQETCRECGKDVSDPETRERMADPLFCDRGGCKAVTDGNGVKWPEQRRCPFKPNR